MLENPVDEDGARAMLRKLSGGACKVHTSLCLIDPSGDTKEEMSSTDVIFKELSEEDIDWWISTGLWKDRSGSFQIEGKGQLLIERIEGDWTGVVGLPVFLVGKMLGCPLP